MNDISKIQKLDIRGKLCPITFVYTKLNLEKMNSGEILEITLDFPPALENIPASCKQQNIGALLEIIEIDAIEKTWLMKIKKI